MAAILFLIKNSFIVKLNKEAVFEGVNKLIIWEQEEELSNHDN